MPRHNVYDPTQWRYRVQFACAVMRKQGNATRRFDACFEMGDGDKVAAHVYARALKDQRLMDVFSRYLDKLLAQQHYHEYFGVPQETAHAAP